MEPTITEESAQEFGYPNALIWGGVESKQLVTVQPCNSILRDDPGNKGRVYAVMQSDKTGGDQHFYTPDQLYEIGLIFLKAAVQQRKINNGELT